MNKLQRNSSTLRQAQGNALRPFDPSTGSGRRRLRAPQAQGTSKVADSLERKRTTPEKAFRNIKRGQRVFVGSGCGEPQYLTRELEKYLPRLADIEILHLLSLGQPHFTDPNLSDHCRLKSFFIATASREAVAEGRADYTPINLFDVPKLFRSEAIPIHVALIQVSPPDSHGFCSLGIAVDIVKSAVENAEYVIAQVNPRMPYTLGDSFLHLDEIDAVVEYEEDLLEMEPPLINDVARAIGNNVATLIEDASTLRVGIGSIPNAILYSLSDKKDLGVHSDILTDAYLFLIEKGVITNRQKTLHPGKIITSFALGSKKLYRFVHNNPMVEFHPVEYTNDYLVIARNDRMITISSALEIDLTGQICADSVGYDIYSGVGGSVDFLRGARFSKGGKAITVLPSTTMDGSRSRIVPYLSEGAGVVTTRGGAGYIVTEYGIVDLFGKTLRERALALVGIAHPKFRESLYREVDRLFPEKKLITPRQAPPFLPKEWEIKQIFPGERVVHFRPVRPVDEARLEEFFNSLPDDETYVRFLSIMKVFPSRDIKSLVNIDYVRKMAVIGYVEENGEEKVIALGCYLYNEDTELAEIDFAVNPSWQRLGIATFLVHYLVEIARSRGIKGVFAYISPENQGILGVFNRTGYVMHRIWEDGVYRIYLDLTQPAQQCLYEPENR